MAADILDLDATDQLLCLTAKEISALDLLKLSLGRHEKTHKRLNAVIAADLERALETAQVVDDRRARGELLGPLAGLPMTIKDGLDVEHMPASAGVEAWRHRWCEDADAVAHARRAGAVIWGKTNVPVMLSDWQSFNPIYGTTNNPWDPKRTSGGSSGGAAAALAAKVTALEIGSDIGGSLRVPASFCGVFSHKPTYALVSQRGHAPPAPGAYAEPDLNVVGPMARSARDLRLLLSVIAGAGQAKAPPADLTRLKIGLWLDDPLLPVDAEARAVIEALAAEMNAAGARIEPIDSPVDLEELMDAYLVLLGGEIGAGLPKGQYRTMQRTRGLARLARAMGADPMSWAGLVLAYTPTHAEWLEANETRERMSAQLDKVFSQYDVIFAPATPRTAFPHNHRAFTRRRLKLEDGRELAYGMMLNWISLATACRLPSTTVPAGLSASGLPVGMQIIGAYGTDTRTLAVAQAIDEDFRGYVSPPGF
ncbi:MAG TPA: amidase family protein [Phenylobacterium sp.]|mgnify:CR=1 FL=1|nr:amidase family protein [Phenylobacterium sp.]HQN49519.1 amidase family protein [Phenylobacterium sp.]